MNERITIIIEGGFETPDDVPLKMERQISLLQLFRNNDPRNALFLEVMNLIRRLYPDMASKDLVGGLHRDLPAKELYHSYDKDQQ